MKNLTFGVVCDKGLKRESNEDCYNIIAGNDGLPTVFMVADGMGGHTMGEVASRMAVDSLSNYIFREKDRFSKNEDIISIINDAINLTNREICMSSGEKDDRKKMGTTLVSAFVVKNKLFIANVGDSRAYRMRSGEITKLTTDHTYIQALLDNGSITEDEAKNHPERHKITKALGFFDDLNPDVFTFEIETGDAFILCTDGLTNMVTEQEILDICLAFPDHQSACNILLEKANANGGDDNITIIIFDVDNGDNYGG